VTRPVYVGGLGFGLKWNMGWMHDTLAYFEHDPVHRRHHHHELTFGLLYAFSEHFVLPLSHDEVVHGKGSLLAKMPGDRVAAFANLRALYAWMWCAPRQEAALHGRRVRPVARVEPRREPRLAPARDGTDAEHSLLAFLRLGEDEDPPVACFFNFTPVPRFAAAFGVPSAGTWTEILNTDAAEYGGSGIGNLGEVEAKAHPRHGLRFSIEVTLPPLGAVFFRGPVLDAADRTAMNRPPHQREER
jgi:1,4-alpha-glucan branching enzyme